jgi:putative ABC transport system permease protein
MLRKTPAFSAAAVATLALGIGATGAILSVGRSVLYRSVPYPDANHLAALWTRDVKRGFDELLDSIPDVQDYQRRARTVDGVSGVTWTDYKSFSLATGAGAERLRGSAVLPGLFGVIGMHPILGREFTPDEFVGDRHVALIGYDLWRLRFAGDPNLVGRSIRINREPYTVVGVLPKGFEVPVLDQGLQILVPFRLDAADARDRSQRLVVAVVRVNPARTVAQARAELLGIGAQLAREHREDADVTANLEAVRESDSLNDAKAQLPVFLTTMLLMVVIAAANVAAILVSRFSARQPELVVRSALGGSRGRLIRQLLSESLMLAGIAGAASILVADWAGDLLISYSPFYMPNKPGAIISAAIVGVILALSAIVGIAFGIYPALAAARANPAEVINRSSARLADGWLRDKTRSGLIAIEVALSVTLIAGAGLMVRTGAKIARMDIGFDPHGVAVGRVSLDAARYATAESQRAFYSSVVERLAARPGVVAATAASHFCHYDPAGWCMGAPLRIPGRPRDDAKPGGIQTAVMPGFFAAMKMPVLRGRAFTDAESTPVIIVDQTFVNSFFPGEDPIGKQVELLASTMRADEQVAPGIRTIVGVVPAVRRVAYWARPFPQAYIPFGQNPVPSMYAVVRTRDDSGVEAIRQTIAQADPDLAVFWSGTMDGWVEKFYGAQRFELVVLVAFALVALVISASGLYAVISYRVRQRAREFGIRLAVGASPRDLQWLLFRQVGVVLALGVIAGVGGAVAIGRLLSYLLVGVRPRDPVMLLTAIALVAAVSFLAVLRPTRTAAHLDPLVALRDQ